MTNRSSLALMPSRSGSTGSGSLQVYVFIVSPTIRRGSTSVPSSVV